MKEGNFPAADFSGKRFLVAEDIEINREYAAVLLRKTGAMVEFAENGQRCVEMVSLSSTGYYDLILMDINMPVMDGLEATKRLRRMGFARPIIALTGNVGDRDKRAALDAGMDAFVEKPVRVEKLFFEMVKCLGG